MWACLSLAPTAEAGVATDPTIGATATTQVQYQDIGGLTHHQLQPLRSYHLAEHTLALPKAAGIVCSPNAALRLSAGA